jgi:hypothetical protein
MDIQLNATDIIFAAHASGTIVGIKLVQKDRGEVVNRRISNQGDFAIHYAGMLGEVAISKYLNIPYRTDITVGGDGYVDMTHHGQTIQIKTSTHAKTPEPRYIIFNNPEEFLTDWAISCSIQSASVVRVHGFTSKKKFMAKHVTHDFGYGIRYCLDEKFLSPIDRFYEAVEMNK